MNKSYKTKMKKNQFKFNLITLAVMFSMVIPATTKASDITEENLLYLINKERTYYSLKPLKSDNDLSRAANLKSKDMINRDYFEHYALGLTPWDFIKNAGYNYLYAGENLAMDFATAEGMVDAWMESDSHRENILNPDYEDIGIGVVKGAYTEKYSESETIMVTNMFGRKKPPIVEVFNNVVDNIVRLFSWN